MVKLLSYVESERSRYSKSNSHEFIFVVSKGNVGAPLSLRGLDYIFDVLSKHLNFHLTPHMLRHKWNEIFSLKAKHLGLSAENIEDIRKCSMGWSESSKMGTLYNEKNLAIGAQKIQQEMQRTQFKKGSK
jgi:hypothetical protein